MQRFVSFFNCYEFFIDSIELGPLYVRAGIQIFPLISREQVVKIQTLHDQTAFANFHTLSNGHVTQN